MENGTIFKAMSPFETLRLVEIEHKFYDVKTGESVAKNLQGYVKRETNDNLFILDDDEFEEAIKAWSEAARASARASRTGTTSGQVGSISRAMWNHEKMRIESAMNQHRGDKEGLERALLSRASKIGDPRKIVTFYHALTDENFHTVASKVESIASSKFKLSSEDIQSPKFLEKSLLVVFKAWSQAARESARAARSKTPTTATKVDVSSVVPEHLTAVNGFVSNLKEVGATVIKGETFTASGSPESYVSGFSRVAGSSGEHVVAHSIANIGSKKPKLFVASTTLFDRAGKMEMINSSGANVKTTDAKLRALITKREDAGYKASPVQP